MVDLWTDVRGREVGGEALRKDSRAQCSRPMPCPLEDLRHHSLLIDGGVSFSVLELSLTHSRSPLGRLTSSSWSEQEPWAGIAAELESRPESGWSADSISRFGSKGGSLVRSKRVSSLHQAPSYCGGEEVHEFREGGQERPL
jgi:hypothetical protein